MAKVTKEQYEKWNGQLENGWFLDLQRLVIWGEKDIRITDKISDTEYVDYTVSFWENYENHRNGSLRARRVMYGVFGTMLFFFVRRRKQRKPR